MCFPCAFISVVLSSDDEEEEEEEEEEGGDADADADTAPCSPAVQTLVPVEDALVEVQSPQKAEDKEQEASDLEDMQVSWTSPCITTDPYLCNEHIS